MLTDSAYYYLGMPRYTEIDTAPPGQFMFVISAGHYKPLTLYVFNSYHPSRLDYQILYVKHGAI
ncbi:MAG: hypothetical protein MJ212_06290, partial [Alphaproteobacteria bacterium]|nr:hypothetical protein [Alphaproteobacteria bacterium]